MDKVISIEGNCTVVKATEEHAESIYPFLRKADQIEIAHMGHHPKDALLLGLVNDDVTYTALDSEGVPFAMFGAGQLEEGGYIWCLGTDGVQDNAYDFLKASRKYTQQLTEPYGATFNYVHDDNKAALKWLKFCGASFIQELAINNQLFYQFAIPYKYV
jgi:hypothetical protein